MCQLCVFQNTLNCHCEESFVPAPFLSCFVVLPSVSRLYNKVLFSLLVDLNQFSRLAMKKMK